MRLASSDIRANHPFPADDARRHGETVRSETTIDGHSDRQAVLDAYPVDGADLKAQLDRLAALAAKICKAPIGLVVLVESDRQRFLGRSGTTLIEPPIEQSFCTHAMQGGGCMIVPDARADDRFRDNPLVTGEPSIRFYAGQPLVSQEGMPLGSLCVIDGNPRAGLTDEQRETLAMLADAVMALLDRARIEQTADRLRTTSESEIAALEQRFQVLADAMPQLVWSTTPDGQADYFNRGWWDFTGQPPEASYGASWLQFLHEEDRPKADLCWATATRTGRDYEVEYRLRRHDGDYRWVIARGMPLRGADGEVVRWIGTCTDIQQQKADAERQEVLSRELNHRIKNIFAVIGGLIAMTIRSKPELTAAGAELRERILALGRAHDFVRSRGGQPVLHPHGHLTALLEVLLAPYQDGERRRIVIAGDDVEIDDRSATPLALFFHELATNAAKYGALSSDDGRITIHIRDRSDIELTWRETGGPPVRRHRRSGFGSSLIEMSVQRQLGGSLDYDWSEEGLCVTARIPGGLLAR